MPLTDPGLIVGDIRDGYVVIKVINAAAGEYHWKSASAAGASFTAATATTAGTTGAVSPPPAGAQDLVLHGDGAWRGVLPDFAGTYDYSAGATITDGGVIYRRTAAGTSGAVFDAGEQAAWEPLGAPGAERAHLTDTAVAPAAAGDPTIAEIVAASGVNRNTVLYYTGDDLPASAPSHVYHIDTSGDVTLLRSPATAAAAFTGASTTVAGAAGDVPPPPIDSQNKVLRGSGVFTEELPAWVTASDYEVGDVVVSGGSIYKANAAHTAAATFAADVANWDALSALSESIFTGDITADAAHTHTLGSFGQDWNNLGTWNINQEIAAFPGNYQSTNLDTARLQVDTFGAPGVNGKLDIQPNVVELGSVSGTETRRLLLDATGSSLTAETTTAATENTSIAAAPGSLELNLGLTADLKVNTDPGAANEILTSQGPNQPPVWSPGAVPMAGADATTAGTAGTVPQPAIAAQDLVLHGDGLFRQVVPNWTAATDYSQGAIVYQGQQIWRRTAAGTSGLTFDAAEQATWGVIADYGGKDTTHLTETAVAPAAAGAPTDAEITAAAATAGLIDAVLEYTGTDTATDPVTHVFHVDQSGAVTLLRSPATADNTAFTADLAADAAHTHALGDFAQTWNNLGTWTINQEIAAFPGSYQATALTTGNLAVNAPGAPGVQSDLDVAPNTARLTGVSGTEQGGVEFTQAPNARTRTYYESTSGGGSAAEVVVDGDGIDLTFGVTEDLRVNTDPGVAGQVLQSAGPDVPPLWASLSAAGFTHPFLVADWSNNSLSTLGDLAPSTSGTINAQSVERFQSFTSTATGDINILDLNLANIGAGGTQTARVRMYDGAGIGGALLAETTVVVTGSTETTYRATFPSAAPVTTGNVFTVGVVRTGTNVPSNSLGWHVTSTDIFPGHTVSNGLLGATDGKVVLDIVPSGASGGSLPIPAATHGLGAGYHHVTVFDTVNDTVIVQGNVDPLTGDVTISTDGALFDGFAYIS